MHTQPRNRSATFPCPRSTGYQWLLDPAFPGKTRIYDGRSPGSARSNARALCIRISAEYYYYDY